MPGRSAGRQNGQVNQIVMDAILSMFSDSEEVRRFHQIHETLAQKGLVKYTFQTARNLARLEGLSYVKKIGRGMYQSNVASDEFKVFDYLQTLRKGQVTRGQVGGTLWKSHEMYFLGMPNSVWSDREANYVLQILTIRLAELFTAFQTLANEMKTRKQEEHKSQSFGLPPMVVRQLLLELIPYYLGSRAGLDFNGLDANELNDVLPKMVGILPEQIVDAKGFSSATQKDDILQEFGLINALGIIHEKRAQNTGRTGVLQEEDNRFALIVTGPEHLVDSKGYEQRWIRDDIIECGKEDESSILLAHRFLSQRRENVLEALKIYGHKYLGSKKAEETKDAYEKLYAANWVAEIINESTSKEKPFSKKERSDITATIGRFINDFGVKALIVNLPFSVCSMTFLHPTPEKEKAIQEFFPQIPAEKIHEWLCEGATTASNIFEGDWKKGKEKFEVPKNSHQ
jgi:hypothetical protein